MHDSARSNDGLHLERVFLRATAAPMRSFSVKVLVDLGELLLHVQAGVFDGDNDQAQRHVMPATSVCAASGWPGNAPTHGR